MTDEKRDEESEWRGDVIGYPDGLRRYYTSFQDSELFYHGGVAGNYISCELGDEPEVGELVFVWEPDGEPPERDSSFGWIARVTHVGEPQLPSKRRPDGFVLFDVSDRIPGTPFFKKAPWDDDGARWDWRPPWHEEPVQVATYISDAGATATGPFTEPPMLNGKPMTKVSYQ